MCDQQTPMEKYRASFSLVNKKVRGCKQGCTIRGKHAYVCMGKSRLDKECFNKEGSTCNPKKINVCKTGVAKFGPTTDTSSRMARIKKIQNRVITKTRTNRGPFSGTQRGAYPRVNEKSNVTRGKPYYPQLFGKRNPRNLSGNKGTSGDYIYFKTVLPRMSYDGIVNTCGGGKVMTDDFEFEIPDNVGGGGGGGGPKPEYPTVNVPFWARVLWKTEKDNTADLKNMLDEQFGIRSDTWQNFTFRWCFPAGSPTADAWQWDVGRGIQDMMGGHGGKPMIQQDPNGNLVITKLQNPIIPDGKVDCDAFRTVFAQAQLELKNLLQNDIEGSGNIFLDVARALTLVVGGGSSGIQQLADDFKNLVIESQTPSLGDDEPLAPIEKALAEIIVKIYTKLSVYFRVESLKNIDKNFNCQLDDEECFDFLVSFLGKSIYWDYTTDQDNGLVDTKGKEKFLSLTQCEYADQLVQAEQEKKEVDVLLNGGKFIDGTDFDGLGKLVDNVDASFGDQKNEDGRENCGVEYDPDSDDYKACDIVRKKFLVELYRGEFDTLYSKYIEWVSEANPSLEREIIERYPGSVLNQLRDSLTPADKFEDEEARDVAIRTEWCLLNESEPGFNSDSYKACFNPVTIKVDELKQRENDLSLRIRSLLALQRLAEELDADDDGIENAFDPAPLNPNIPVPENPLFEAITNLRGDVVETLGEGVKDLGNVVGDAIIDGADIIRDLPNLTDENGVTDVESADAAAQEVLESAVENLTNTAVDVINDLGDDIAGSGN